MTIDMALSLDRRAVLADIDAVLGHRPPAGGVEGIIEIATMIKACIARWAPAGSAYRRMADPIDPLQLKPSDADVRLRGVLVTLKRDYRAGMLGTVHELGHATIFADLIAQAHGLWVAGCGAAAAVVGGAALEAHLRQLAQKLDVAVERPDGGGVFQPRSPQALNDELGQFPAYPPALGRLIAHWLEVRDRAAHGRASFEETTRDDLKSMVDGIRAFIRQHPA